jgi:DNA-binding NarL/FixJ family response regulator
MASQSHQLTVIVGSFDPVLRPGLIRALRSDPQVEVVAVGLDGRRLEDAIGSLRPSVVLVGNIDGRSAIQCLKASCSSSAIVVLAAAPAPSYGRLLVALGASCVAQGASVEGMLDAIRFAARGGRILLAENGERVEREPSDTASLLTPRELIVLEHLSKPGPYGRIAKSMEVEVETVRKHAASIRRKLNVERRLELIGLLFP